MAAGVGQVGHVGVEVLATAGAVMLREEHDEIAGPPGQGIAEVVEGAATAAIAVGAFAASRTGPSSIVAAVDAHLGLGQILGAGDPHGGIGAVFAGSWHGVTPGKKGPTRKYARLWQNVHRPRPVSLL